MIAYLSANNLPNTAAALREELGLGEDAFDPGTAKKYESLLEKKWTGIVRLQKKVHLLPVHISSALRHRIGCSKRRTSPNLPR